MFALTWNPFWHFLANHIVCSVWLPMYMYVNKAGGFFEVQNLVCLFKGNYFELHNIEFFKTCKCFSL